MLKQVGSVVVAGLVGAMSYSAQGDQPNPMIPIALAGGAFLASSVLFNKLEPDLSIPTVTTPSVTHTAHTTHESGKKKGKKAVKAAKPVVATPEPASPAADEDEEPEEVAEEEEEAPAAAPKKGKKGKKDKKKEEKKATPAAAAPKAKETPKKADKKKEEKKAAAPAAAAPKKAEKKEEKKKTAAAPAAPKKAEEKKAAGGDKKKKGKKTEEKKAAPVAAAPEPTGSDEEDEDGWKVVRNNRPPKAKSDKGAAGDKDATAAAPAEEKKRPESQDTIKIDPERHGIIIGPGGQHIALLKQKTGADIQVPKQGSNDWYIKMSGSAEAVRNAKAAIAQLAKDGWSKATHEGWDSSELKLNDEKDRGLIIGVKGANIQQLQRRYNVQIKTPAATETSNVITISGEKDALRDCKLAIRRILELGYNPETNRDFITRTIPVTKQQVMMIVGAKGSQIKHITKTTKIYRINTPKRDEDEQVVTLIGTEPTVDHAERMIMSAIAPAEPEDQWTNEQAVFDENAAWN